MKFLIFTILMGTIILSGCSSQQAPANAPVLNIDSIKKSAVDEKLNEQLAQKQIEDNKIELQKKAVAKQKDNTKRQANLLEYQQLLDMYKTELAIELDKLEQTKQPRLLRSATEREDQLREIYSKINEYKAAIADANANIKNIKLGKAYDAITNGYYNDDTNVVVRP